MDTRLLRIFRAVAKHSGLANAARELHLTPSALSHALKSLETEVGCRLFERVGNKMILNQAGEHLQAGIEQPLRAIENAAAAVKELSHWGHGRLRVGASVTACQQILPHAFRELKNEYPQIHLAVETGDMPHLITLLAEHHIDLAIGVEPEQVKDLELRPLFEDELLFVFSNSHPWNDGRTLSKEEIRSQALILYQRNSPTTRLVTQYFRNQRIELGPMMEVASITAIKEMVKLNIGVSILAPWTVDPELSRRVFKMRPLGTKALRRRWVVAHSAQKRLTLAEEKFCRLCRNQATALRKDRKELPTAK